MRSYENNTKPPNLLATEESAGAGMVYHAAAPKRGTMLTINYSYNFGEKFPLLFDGIKIGDRLVHRTLGGASVHKIESENWFVVRFDDPKIHRQRVNVEGSSFNGLDPIFSPE
jgi:hypothetical protein